MSGFYSIDDEMPEVEDIQGGPLSQGDAFDLTYETGKAAADIRNPGAMIDLWERKNKSFQMHESIFKKYKDHISTPIPKNIYPTHRVSVPQMYADQEALMWNETNRIRAELVKKGILKEEDFPESGPLLESNQRDEALRRSKNLYDANVRGSEHPFTTGSAELLSGFESNFDPVTNPYAVMHLAMGIVAPGSASIGGIVLTEGALGLLESAVEAPSRKELADIYGEQYGLSDFGKDVLTNIAFNIALPVGFRTLKTLPKTSIYKLASAKFRRGSTAADDALLRARAAEFADNPLNLLNDLSFPERIARFHDGMGRFTRAFLDGKTVGADGGILTQAELRRILDIDTKNLTPTQKGFISDIRNTLDDLKDETGIGEELFESGIVIKGDDGNLTVRTTDGEEIPLFNAKEANVLQDGEPIQFRRNKSKGKSKGAVADDAINAVAPEIPKGKEFAELAPANATRRTSGSRASNDPVDVNNTNPNNLNPSSEPRSSDIPVVRSESTVPGGTVDSTSFGVDEMTPTLKRQNEILDETFSKETRNSLAEDIGRIDKDFEYVMEDGSVVDAGTFVKTMAIKKRQADNLKICGVGK